MMDGLLMAGSPVEIEAKADEAGLAAAERGAALALFHLLTSRLELTLLDSTAEGGEAWPRHRFWFGLEERVGRAAAALRAMPGVSEPPETAPVLFVMAQEAGYAGLLAAGSKPGWHDGLDAVM